MKILIATEKIETFLSRTSSSGKYNQEEIKPSKLCLRKEEKNGKKTTCIISMKNKSCSTIIYTMRRLSEFFFSFTDTKWSPCSYHVFRILFHFGMSKLWLKFATEIKIHYPHNMMYGQKKMQYTCSCHSVLPSQFLSFIWTFPIHHFYTCI